MKKRDQRTSKTKARFGNHEPLEPRTCWPVTSTYCRPCNPTMPVALDAAAPAAARAYRTCQVIGLATAMIIRFASTIFGNQFFFDPAPELSNDILTGDGIPDDGPVADGGLDVPILHSNPSATQKIFLDFDGQVVSGTNWNQYNNNNPIHAPPIQPTQFSRFHPPN